MEKFNQQLKGLVNEVKTVNFLSFFELDLIEDYIETLEEFIKGEKESIPEEQRRKNKKNREESFYKKINKILGVNVDISVEDLIKMKNEINQLRDKYGYDEMNEEQKEEFEEKVWGYNTIKKEEPFVENVDKIDEIHERGF